MENFLLPSKIEFEPGTNPLVGSLVVTPCYHGYGTTLGNALRRVLLSSLIGGAVETFKIKGAQHEFSTVDGVQEDMVEIMLNLKQLAVRVYSEEPVTLTLTKKGPGVVTAADFAKNADVDVINKDLVIATLTNNKPFEMEVTVAQGRGYRPVEEKDKKSYDLGTIVIDSVYTPVKDVGYKVENTRVGDITNFEKLTLSIETNGAISPEEAVKQATQILMDHFSIILDSMGTVGASAPAVVDTAAEVSEEATEEVGTEVETDLDKPAKKAVKKVAAKKKETKKK